MRVRPEQLAALAAIVDHGTFDAAARALSVTPSAISQRVRALEAAVGHVVVVRTSPARTTPAGDVLLRMARQQALVESEALAALSGTDAPTREVSVAVNADSLATWFRAVLASAAGWTDVTLRLHVEDQDHSSALLRSGAAVAAVTSDAEAVQGCSVERLGTMRYVPVAAPSVADRLLAREGPGWAGTPVVRFDRKDELQDRVLAAQGVRVPPPTHHVPSPGGFVAAVRAGLGWGVVPRDQLGDDLTTGRLVRLPADDVEVPLHWQCWRLRTATVDRLSAAVRAAARTLDA
ncbi:LysR family transcriptional regulator ArgP [Cellulomonas carbonis]|uniref:LysR family transcriptional regulator n=1 Tax=Cellulomonas carbonis T26 TaxID=947969 RepID=A0A0A0BR98_9CELL|nr:LysR family transcriptional regulator ArgP [Cellulomonas carbonis]KGM10480.1 LysR family transcriptional regulator [Cellulomonas carbonis T26]GGC04669.1 putative HTH-type transcriptional regulator [Cellulomonas carbonis]